MYKRIEVETEVKRLYILLLILPVLLSSLTIFRPSTASAWTNTALPTCNIDLSWNWKTQVSAGMESGTTPATPLSVESFPSSIIVQTSDGKTSLLLGNSGYFDKDLSTNHYYYRIADTNVVQNNTYPSTTWYLNLSSKTVQSTGKTPAYYTGHPYSTNPASTPDVTCVRYAQGFDYHFNYDGPRFGSVMPQEGSAECTGALDVGCWIAKAFNGVTNTITDVAKASFAAFTKLFVPDRDNLTSKITTLKNNFLAQLGFLAYPFTFLYNFFSAFGGSGSWCSASNCTWNGNVMNGGQFTIDVLALKHTAYAPAWDYFILFVRGVTIISLLMMLHRKFLEVTQR